MTSHVGPNRSLIGPRRSGTGCAHLGGGSVPRSASLKGGTETDRRRTQCLKACIHQARRSHPKVQEQPLVKVRER